MSELTNEILKDVHDDLNVPQLLEDLLAKVIEPALKSFAADSSNSYDDMLVGAIMPLLEGALKSQGPALWDKLVK